MHCPLARAPGEQLKVRPSTEHSWMVAPAGLPRESLGGGGVAGTTLSAVSQGVRRMVLRTLSGKPGQAEGGARWRVELGTL